MLERGVPRDNPGELADAPGWRLLLELLVNDKLGKG
jgi:hypothetical protein